MHIHSQNLQTFWYYITERHAIFHKKHLKKLPLPWTDDQILREYKFTNVFRDLDPGTIYITDRIIPVLKGDTSNLLFNLIIYRLFNK